MTYSDNNYKTVSPSQWINLGYIFFGIVGIYYVLPTLLAIAKILSVYYWRYEFNERTLVERKGILSVTRRELHYYRIKSISVDEPFFLRIFGLANIHIKSSDPYQPELTLIAVPLSVVIL